MTTTISERRAGARGRSTRAARLEIVLELRAAERRGGGAERRDADLHRREEPLGLVAQRLDRERAACPGGG